MKQHEYQKLTKYEKAWHLRECAIKKIGFEELAREFLWILPAKEQIRILEHICERYNIEIYEEN